MKVLLLFIILPSVAFSQNAVYPLDIGNRWEYVSTVDISSTPTYYYWEIDKDTIFANGISYAVLTEQGGGYTSFEYLRQQGDSVFLYSTVQMKENLYFDYSRKKGDTVNTIIQGNDTTDIVLKNLDTVNIYGSTRRIWTFYINRRQLTDDEYTLTVIDSLGIYSRYQMMGSSSSLRGALIRGRVFGTITGIKQEKKFQPEEFLVYQNYPNPFNPSTTIRVQLYRQSDISFEVFDVKGRCVIKYFYPSISSGNYNIHFDGSGLPTGSYYYRINTNSGRRTYKMILLK